MDYADARRMISLFYVLREKRLRGFTSDLIGGGEMGSHIVPKTQKSSKVSPRPAHSPHVTAAQRSKRKRASLAVRTVAPVQLYFLPVHVVTRKIAQYPKATLAGGARPKGSLCFYCAPGVPTFTCFYYLSCRCYSYPV